MKRRSRENVVLSGRLNRIGIEHVALLVFSMAAWGAVSSTILAQKVPVVVGEFATGSFSASNNNHQGIAYNSVDQVYAITDTQDDQVYIVDRKGVRLPGSDFDTTTFGSDLPTGIALDHADSPRRPWLDGATAFLCPGRFQRNLPLGGQRPLSQAMRPGRF